MTKKEDGLKKYFFVSILLHAIIISVLVLWHRNNEIEILKNFSVVTQGASYVVTLTQPISQQEVDKKQQNKENHLQEVVISAPGSQRFVAPRPTEKSKDPQNKKDKKKIVHHKPAAKIVSSAAQRASGGVAKDLSTVRSLKKASWLQYVAPVYPTDALLNEEQGTVVLAIQLDANGKYLSSEIIRSSGYAALDNAALVASRSWQAKGSGAPVTVATTVRFTIK